MHKPPGLQATPHAQAPAQAATYPPRQPYSPAFVQPLYPEHFAPHPIAYPYPPAAALEPAFHGWQSQPAASYAYQQSATTPYPASYPHDARPPNSHGPEAQAALSLGEMSTIEEVREGLREFREAIRDLAENRTRRRYS
jgi:hypothetical protein